MTWSLLRTAITLSILVVLTLAQKNCDVDTDCLGNQYCYSASQLCANFTNCSWYNRRESPAGPARLAEQCGECIAGFTAENTLDGVADNCVKNSADSTDSGNISDDDTNAWIIGGVVTLFCIAVIIGIAHMCWHNIVHCVRPCNNNEDQQPEKTTSASVSPMVRMPPRASAPPPSPNKNNNRYKDLEDNAPSNQNLISKIGEYDRGQAAISNSRPVKAQPFHQPHWVHPAPDYTYDEENQLTTMTENDEETMSSDWTPGQSIPISSRPFRVITEEQEVADNNGDNNTINETHDRLPAAGSLPALTSNSREERENWQNDESSNSGSRGAAGNSRNQRGNSNSFIINMQITQTVNNREGNSS